MKNKLIVLTMCIFVFISLVSFVIAEDNIGCCFDEGAVGDKDNPYCTEENHSQCVNSNREFLGSGWYGTPNYKPNQGGSACVYYDSFGAHYPSIPIRNKCTKGVALGGDCSDAAHQDYGACIADCFWCPEGGCVDSCLDCEDYPIVNDTRGCEESACADIGNKEECRLEDNCKWSTYCSVECPTGWDDFNNDNICEVASCSDYDDDEEGCKDSPCLWYHDEQIHNEGQGLCVEQCPSGFIVGGDDCVEYPCEDDASDQAACLANNCNFVPAIDGEDSKCLDECPIGDANTPGYYDDGTGYCREKDCLYIGGEISLVCAETSAEYSPKYDEVIDGETHKCCKVAAPDYEECCKFQWQCDADDPIDWDTTPILPYEYLDNYPKGWCNYRSGEVDTDKIPCSNECLKPQCRIGFKISSNVNLDPDFAESYPGVQTHCWCGDEAYDMSQAGGYCCEGNIYSDVLCGAQAKINGTVINVTDEDPSRHNVLAGVQIIFYDSRNMQLHTTYTDESGYYEYITTTAVDYMKVIKSGFKINITNISFTEEERNLTINVSLIEKPKGACTSANPPGVPKFERQHVTGKPYIRLNWTDPDDFECAGMVDAILIYRHKVITDDDGDGEPDEEAVDDEYIILPVKNGLVSVTEYIDGGSWFGGLEWEKTYQYNITLHYTTGVMSVHEQVEITLGSSRCEGKFAGDEEFCYNYEKNLCGVDNSYSSIEEEDNCEDGVEWCVGPDTDNNTECRFIDTSECKNFGKPFGIFYNQTYCERDGYNCYYDFSSTNTDVCSPCRSEMSCFDYKSEQACKKDRCYASSKYVSDSGNNACQWINTSPDLGKGICYDPDYEGKDECDRCEFRGELFGNTGCSPDLCSSLGSCYSNNASYEGLVIEDLTCEACSGQQACSDYSYKESCEADSCGLGSCNWGGVGEEGQIRCYKDADDDGEADCIIYPGLDEDEANQVRSCREDNYPLNTSAPLSIPFMNNSGSYINFVAETVDGDSLSFCVGGANNFPNCDLDFNAKFGGTEELPLDEFTAAFNPINYHVDFDRDISGEVRGVYAINFSTNDTHRNQERNQFVYFYADTEIPKPVINYYLVNDTMNNVTVITLESEEYLSCSYTVSPDSGDGAPNEDTLMKDNFKDEDDGLFNEINRSFYANFTNLDDGEYIFTFTCQDDAGNVNVTEFPVRVDFYQNIENILVNNIEQGGYLVFNGDRFEINFTVTDPLDCELINESGYKFETKTTSSVEVESDEYRHSWEGSISEDGTYVIRIECKRGEVIVDQDIVRFARDTTPPVTRVFIGDSSTPLDFEAWHQPETKIRLVCDDVDSIPIGEYPREAGCPDDDGEYYTKYKLSSSQGGAVGFEHLIDYDDQLTLFDEADVGYHFRYLTYASIDKLGNQEIVNLEKEIKVDNVDPKVYFRNFYEFTRDSPYIVYGSAEDERDLTYGGQEISRITITINNVPWEIPLDAAADNQKVEFQWTVNLQEGPNQVYITAYDQARNSDQKPGTIYLDLVGPEIEATMVLYWDDPSYLRSDNECDEESDPACAEPLRAEYEHDLAFVWELDDGEGSGIKVDEGNIAPDLKVEIECYNGPCSTFTVTGEDLEYDEDSDRYVYYYDQAWPNEMFPVGNYTAFFSGSDKVGNHMDRKVWFNVSDTTEPDLEFISRSEIIEQAPDADDGGDEFVAYSKTINITGITEPGATVKVRVVNSTTRNSKDANQVTGRSANYPKDENLVDVVVGDGYGVAVYEDYPKKGDNIIYFNGVNYISGDADVKIEVGDYIEFKDSDGDVRYEVPRYKVIDSGFVYSGDPPLYVLDEPWRCQDSPEFECYSWIEIEPSLRATFDDVPTITVYNEEKPAGWFDIEIPLYTDAPVVDNELIIWSVDGNGIINTGYSAADPLDVEYQNVTLSAKLISPNTLYQDVLGNIFPISFDSDFTIKVKTDYPAVCYLAHPEDKVAGFFEGIEMNTSDDVDGMTGCSDPNTCHYLRINETGCGTDGGYGYCNLSGFNVSHNYNITCEPLIRGITMNHTETCFVMVDNTLTPAKTPYGESNLCDIEGEIFDQDCSTYDVPKPCYAGVTLCEGCGVGDEYEAYGLDCICASDCSNAGAISDCEGPSSEAPSIKLVPRNVSITPYPPEDVYLRLVNITGVTDPGATVEIKVFNESSDQHGSTIHVVGEDEEDVKSGPHSLYPVGFRYPGVGDDTIAVIGHLNPEDIAFNDFIEFTDEDDEIIYQVPRFEVTNIVTDTIGEQPVTIITFNPKLPFNVEEDSTLNVYKDEIPAGWFEAEVDLYTDYDEHVNSFIVRAIGQNFVKNTLYDLVGDRLEITHHNLTLPTVITLPSQEYTYPDDTSIDVVFDANFTIKVSTAPYASTCYISHTSDYLAGTFNKLMDEVEGSDGTEHVFKIDRDKCGGGYGFCKYGGFNISHNYEITCESDIPGIKDNETDFCFVMVNNTLTKYKDPVGQIDNLCEGESCLSNEEFVCGRGVKICYSPDPAWECGDPSTGTFSQSCICPAHCNNPGAISDCGGFSTDVPLIDLIPSTDDMRDSYITGDEPYIVYSDKMELSGITEPGADVYVTVVHESAAFDPKEQVHIEAKPVSEPKDLNSYGTEFLINAISGKWPERGNDTIRISGKLLYDIDEGDYLEFTDSDGDVIYEVPRYKVRKLYYYDHTHDSYDYTLIRFDPALPTDKLASGGITVRFYEEAFPSGWFNFSELELFTGDDEVLNFVDLEVVGTNGAANQDYYYPNSLEVITRAGAAVEIVVENPVLAGELYYTTDKEFDIVVTTNYDSNCIIEHKNDDAIAMAFYEGMDSEDGLTHTFSINVDKCNSADPPGQYCTVGAYELYHEYNISCRVPGIQGLTESWVDLSILDVSADAESMGNEGSGNLCEVTAECGPLLDITVGPGESCGGCGDFDDACVCPVYCTNSPNNEGQCGEVRVCVGCENYGTPCMCPESCEEAGSLDGQCKGEVVTNVIDIN